VYIRFVLMGEGSSDDGLIPHLEQLCVAAGADQVEGVRFAHERLNEKDASIAGRLRVVADLEPGANLVFIHADADAPGGAARRQAIASQVQASRYQGVWVPVVPVQETEAWLLLSEDAIRRVVGRPGGSEPLSLPRPRDVELTPEPKERLRAARLAASGATGRRLARAKQSFNQHRRLLLERLPVADSPLQEVPAWRELRDDVARAIQALCGIH
jgi:hypothetical protein